MGTTKYGILGMRGGLTLPDGDAASIVTPGTAARMAVTPSASTNGNGHLAVMGDSVPTIRAPSSAAFVGGETGWLRVS
jgi:hypothetical protein